MEERSIAEILRRVLSENRTLLQNRDALTDAMDHAVPARLARTYLPIRKAITEAGIGETICGAANGGISARSAATRTVANALIGFGVPELQAEEIASTMANFTETNSAPAVSPLPNVRQETVPVAQAWTCVCGQTGNIGNFCQNCGKARVIERDLEETGWRCEYCAAMNEDGNFCGSCGKPRQTSRRRRTSGGTTAPVSTVSASPTVPAAAVVPVAAVAPVAGQSVASSNVAVASAAVPQSVPPPYAAYPAGGQAGWQTTRQRTNDEIFTTEGRLNRWPYFTKSLLLSFGGSLAWMCSLFIPDIGPLIALVIGVGICVGSWMLIIRRLHDLNKSGWFALLLLVPIIDFFFALYLLFVKGTDGPNDYGPDPLQPAYLSPM